MTRRKRMTVRLVKTLYNAWRHRYANVGMVVAPKNLELYPVYCEEMGVKKREKTLNRPFGHDADVV